MKILMIEYNEKMKFKFKLMLSTNAISCLGLGHGHETSAGVTSVKFVLMMIYGLLICCSGSRLIFQ